MSQRIKPIAVLATMATNVMGPDQLSFIGLLLYTARCEFMHGFVKNTDAQDLTDFTISRAPMLAPDDSLAMRRWTTVHRETLRKFQA
jgi:hypothetical protein